MQELIFLPLITGLISGASVSFFVYTLGRTTELNQTYPGLCYILPLAGALVGFFYRYYGKTGKTDTGQILEEIHSPNEVLPLRFAPLVYITTLLSHLAGASVGREGAAVQISASLSDQLSKVFRVNSETRKSLLLCGIGAGFSSAIGAPMAGMVFGMELTRGKNLNFRHFIQCSIASLSGYALTKVIHLEHLTFPQITAAIDPQKSIASSLLASLAFAAVIHIFFFYHRHFADLLKRLFKAPVLRGAIGGTLILLIYLFFNLEIYHGLGTETILASFASDTPTDAPLLKILLTTLALSAGFKGGEFIPLVFIGATTGNTLNRIAQLPEPLLPALGSVALFGAASKAPITCMILAVEFFGFQIAPYAIPCVLLTYFLSGKKSLYHSTH
jgi:H+/Cl- antiporter ClcA